MAPVATKLLHIHWVAVNGSRGCLVCDNVGHLKRVQFKGVDNFLFNAIVNTIYKIWIAT